MQLKTHCTGAHDPGGRHAQGLRCVVSVTHELCGYVGAVGCSGTSSSLLTQAVCTSSLSQCGLCGHVSAVSRADALSVSSSLLVQAVGVSLSDVWVLLGCVVAAVQGLYGRVHIAMCRLCGHILGAVQGSAALSSQGLWDPIVVIICVGTMSKKTKQKDATYLRRVCLAHLCKCGAWWWFPIYMWGGLFFLCSCRVFVH